MTAAARSELPRFLLDLIAACPRSGEGVQRLRKLVRTKKTNHLNGRGNVTLLAPSTGVITESTEAEAPDPNASHLAMLRRSLQVCIFYPVSHL